MAGENDSNKTAFLKWALLLFRVVGGNQQKRTILCYVTVISLFIINLFIIMDLILNVNGIASLNRITFLPNILMTSLKGSYLLLNPNLLSNIVNHLRTFWRPDKFNVNTEKDINKFAKYLTIIVAMYTLNGYAACSLMAGTVFVDFEEKHLIYNDFTFCDLNRQSCWIPMYIWQFFALMFQLLPAALGFDCLFVSLVGYVIIACKLLKIGLQKLNSDNLLKRKHLLKEIVKQHVFIMDFLNKLNDLFRILMFLQFTTSLWSMILLLNLMMANGFPPKVADISFVGPLYAIVVFQLFLYATGGAIVEDRIQRISTDMFTVNWFGRNRTDLRKDLSLMIFRAQRTRVLSVGKMSDLNYPLFITTVKNSFSVFTLIWQLSNQDSK